MEVHEIEEKKMGEHAMGGACFSAVSPRKSSNVSLKIHTVGTLPLARQPKNSKIRRSSRKSLACSSASSGPFEMAEQDMGEHDMGGHDIEGQEMREHEMGTHEMEKVETFLQTVSLTMTCQYDLTSFDFDAHIKALSQRRLQPRDTRDPGMPQLRDLTGSARVRANSLICSICQDLDFQADDYDSHVLDVRIRDLESARQAGCPSCTLLAQGLVGVYGALDLLKMVCLLSIHPATPLIAMVVFEDGRNPEALEFFVDESSPSKWPIIGAARELSVDSSSESCLALAAKFLEECIQSHEQCKRKWKSRLPRRVIDVRSADDSVKLHEAGEEYGNYSALSYCWGKSATPMITTTTNIDERKVSIPFADLPKTFQDAVSITRALGIPYLWIDSLCILQDSATDWEREAFQMRSVFSNALIIIAADGSEDSDGGCFVAKDRLIVLAQVTCPGAIEGQPSEVKIRKQGFQIDTSIAHVQPYTPRSKLSTRGWVLQERLLSPRTLHFTGAEMVWECKSQIRCECQVSPVAASSGPTFKSRFISAYAEYGPTFCWSDVVEEFIARDLTFPKDRLAALSGIAAIMATAIPLTTFRQQTKKDSEGQVENRVGSEIPEPWCLAHPEIGMLRSPYIAGLWGDRIDAELLWYVPKHVGQQRNFSERQEYYIAHSWSWASVTAAVRYSRMQTPEAGFQEMLGNYEISGTVASKEAPAGNTFGPVKSAYIKADGWLAVPVRLHMIQMDSQEAHEGLWLVVSERELREDKRAYFQEQGIESRPNYEMPNFYLSSRVVTPAFPEEGDSEPFLSQARLAIIENIIETVQSDTNAACNLPFDSFFPDVTAQGSPSELNEDEPYLLLLLGFEYVFDGDRVEKKRAYGLVLRKCDGGINWKRVGFMMSYLFLWESWCSVASPCSLTLV